MGVPEIKMFGAPKADSPSFLEDFSLDAFPPLDMPSVSSANAAPKPERESKPGMPPASGPQSAGANEKKPDTKPTVPVFRRPGGDKSSVASSRAGNAAAAAPVQQAPAKSAPIPAPAKAAPAQASQPPQPVRAPAAGASAVAGAPTGALAPPANAQGEQNHGSDDLTQSLLFHVDNDDSSVMATKLHLAIAYQDIGEKDGARLLLEEVVRGGSPDQSEKARLMLAILARSDE